MGSEASQPRAAATTYTGIDHRAEGSTGEYVWHYQVVPGDIWDYDATQDVVLADLTIDGKLRKVAMQAGKDGYLLRARSQDRRADLGQ